MTSSITSVRTLQRAGALCAVFACSAGLSAQSVSFQGDTFTNHGLVGVGRIAASTVDSFGETFGSFSAFYLDQASWSCVGNSYSGTLYTQPDRGYNGAGTTNYAPRFNEVSFTFTPTPGGAVTQNQVAMNIVATTRFQEANTTLFTSIDPTPTGTGSRPAVTSQALPQAYNGRLALDAEGIVRRPDGTLYVSDEYGPYVYRFAADGTLLSVLNSPAALLPQRSGATSFASNNPEVGQLAPSPANPSSGRQNNQGLEGLTISPDGTKLYALLQSAARQDLNTSSVPGSRANTRMLVYDLASDPANPTLIAEHVVQLPTYTATGGVNPVVAAQSELIALNDTQFLLLARDGRGNGLDNPGTAAVDEGRSDFRSILLLDISSATDIAGTSFDNLGASIAPGGVLNASITPALSSAFIDLNNALELAKFGLGNGTSFGADNLSEKWEALALAPALDLDNPNDYFLFVGNDNDFITGSGFQDGDAYDAGFENDNMVLVYRVTLPTATLAAIPEPASFAALGGLAVLGLAAARRRRRA
ncbi:MAG: esterase-like activity of phytase family protein [Burkholderiales bacterium]|nr:esterase-like activity of phytase family protein [Opitutaceae bacterium]